jgi:hypothetical protein
MAAWLKDDIFAIAEMNQGWSVQVAIKSIHDTNLAPPKPELMHSVRGTGKADLI